MLPSKKKISYITQTLREHPQSTHLTPSLLPPFFTSLFATVFGYPSSRYGVDVTKSASSMCTNRSKRWHHGPFGPAWTSPFIGTPSLSIPPGQNPRRICSLEPHCLPHWSIRLFKFVARPTLRCINFLSVGSTRIAGWYDSRKAENERGQGRAYQGSQRHRCNPQRRLVCGPSASLTVTRLGLPAPNIRVSNLRTIIHGRENTQHGCACNSP